MKAFSQLTDAELLGITNDDLNDAIRIEAIERAIQPPITLSEALRKSEFAGYQLPAEMVEVWEINKSGYFSSASGIAYLSKESAERALQGIVYVEQDYKTKGWKVSEGEPTVICRRVGINPAQQKIAKFEEFTQNNEEFDKVAEECTERLSVVRQEAYDAKVRQEKRAEYMRLANGDEGIAMAFWNKVERGTWPKAESQQAEAVLN